MLEEYIINNIDSAYRFAYTYVRNSQDAEDVVGESVVKALSAVNSLRETKYIKAWFYKIISNTAISFLKKQKKYEVRNEEIEIPFVEDYAKLTFGSITENLEIKYREIIVLRFLEDMSIKEISAILGINKNTVKTRLYKALAILKVDMEEDV